MAFLSDKTNGTSTLDASDYNNLKHAFKGTLTDEIFTLLGMAGSKYGSGDIFFFETSGLAYIGVNCYWNGTIWVRNNTLNPARLFEFSPSTNSVAVYTVASGGGRTYQTSYIDRGIEAGIPRAGENVQANGAFTTLGDAQTSTLIARIDTVAAGDLDLTLDGVALAGVGNTITIEENKCFSFIGQVTARRDDGSEVAAWRFEGILNRQTGGDATISGDTVTAIGTPPVGWGFSLFADTVNQALELTATSPGAINIHWCARVTLVEVS